MRLETSGGKCHSGETTITRGDRAHPARLPSLGSASRARAIAYKILDGFLDRKRCSKEMKRKIQAGQSHLPTVLISSDPRERYDHIIQD
jgi:hypothetical protein